MSVLNEIPASLRDPSGPDDDLTPLQLLGKGAIRTFYTALICGAVLWTITYFAPFVTMNLVFNGIWGFFVAWALVAVMYNTANMVGAACGSVVIVHHFLIFFVNHLVYLLHKAAEINPPVSAWSLFSLSQMVGLNVMAIGCMAIVLYLCWDGDSRLLEVGGGVKRRRR
jgi:hypothetical protein